MIIREVVVDCDIEGLEANGLKSSIEQNFEDLKELVEPGISHLRVTSNYENVIADYAKEFGFEILLTRSRGLVSAEKIITLPSGELHIIVNGRALTQENHVQVIFANLIEDHAFRMLHEVSKSWSAFLNSSTMITSD